MINSKLKTIAIILLVTVSTSLLSLSSKWVNASISTKNNAAAKPEANKLPLLADNALYAGPSVVELFTSEGCSSCPSADKLLAKAQAEFKEQTIVLSYHVDYWDRLGWKDPFSKSIFSERQRQYAQRLQLESVYTPQAIVNGSTEFVGSNKSALWNAIERNSNQGVSSIEAKASVKNNTEIAVTYTAETLQPNQIVVLALVLKNATTEVKRGENEGATLSHINIVQELTEVEGKTGNVKFTLPKNFVKDQYMVVAFLQNKNTYQITGATKEELT